MSEKRNSDFNPPKQANFSGPIEDDPIRAVRHAITMENSSVHSPIKQPRMLGRYRILEEVGRGATALVYRAYDPQLDRFLAIKVLRDQLAKNDDYRDGFIREARLAAQLTHPNIVTIFDVGITDGKPYIAMELLEGATLEQILKTKSKLPLKTVLAIAGQLASALAYAHEQGVVHRDIKPGNILVLKDKKTTKLTDFGIAQIDENMVKSGKLIDKVLGTPEYMSPEQILGQQVDSRTDLYSTGVLIYRMLAGLPPFISDDLGKLFKQIIKNKPPELVIDNELVKDDLKDLLRKLLQKRAQKRFQSAALLVSELRAISNKLVKKKTRENVFSSSLSTRWTLTMAATVFVTMCIGLVVVYWMQYKALSGITFDYGHTVGRMIAYQSSEAVLLKDSIGLNALIKESAKNEQLESIVILNLSEQILASSLEQRIGQAFNHPDDGDAIKIIDKTKIYRRELEDGKVLFDVSMPIYYSDKKVGGLFVSFSAESMYRASNTTLITMLLVMLITLFTVSIATFILARQTSRDYKRVAQGLQKMSVGRIDARIYSQRNNEAGQLFAAFNQLAAYLERFFDKTVPHDRRSGDYQSNVASDTKQFDVTPAVSEHQYNQQDVDTIEISLENDPSLQRASTISPQENFSESDSVSLELPDKKGF